MKAIIVDDEYKSIELLKGYASEISFVEIINTFRNPVEAIAFLQKEKTDLLFLDINMPRLTGIQVVKSLPTKPIIIFTTAYSQHAVEGFELDATDYLMKPITFQRFLKAVTKANDMYKKNNEVQPMTTSEFVLIRSGPQTHHLKRTDILYIEKDGNYSTFHTTTGKIVTRHNFAEALEMIGGHDMIRVHKSFIVSRRHVSLIETHEITINKTKIPVGAAYREVFLKLIETQHNRQ